MPGFDLTFASGSYVTDWIDSGGTDGYCRLNPKTGQALRRRKCVIGTPVVIQCLIDSDLLTDAELTDGNLFHWSNHEAPHLGPAVVVTTTGTSAEATFTPVTAGHYLFSARRQDHGRIYFHLDVEAT